jgi:beta-lactamase regulating signal transducer with metallopeptidase domain/Tol biopolymer transport system component
VGIERFDALGRWLVNDIGWVSAEILVLTGIVYFLTKWGRVRSSRTRRWLWTLAVAKPLVTLLFTWSFAFGGGSGQQIAPLQGPPPMLDEAPSLASAVSPGDFLAGVAAAGPVPSSSSQPAAARGGGSTPLRVRVAGGSGITGFAVLGAIWLAGVVGLGLYTALGAGWLLRVRQSAVLIAADDLVAACEQYSDAVAELIQKVDVRLTTRLSEPCIYGFPRATILLPTWCLEDNTPPNLEYILLHEGMHHRAKDHWFLGLRRAMEVLLWFHPAVWYAGHKAMSEAENVCDEAVVNLAYAHGTPSAALVYSSCLMRVLERATRHSFETLVPGVIPTAERIRRLVQQTGPFANSVSVATIVAVVGLAIVSLPGAGGPRASLAEVGYTALTRREPPVSEVLFTTKRVGDYHYNLYVARSDGTGVRRLTHDECHYEEASWSPDGSRIAAYSWQPETGGWTTYILDANGTVLHSLCGPGWGPRGATWSPDGKHIIATGRRMPRQGGTDTTYNLYRFDANQWEIHRLTDDTVDRRLAAWSPDGRTVAYLRARSGAPGFDLALMDPDGTGERVIHHDEPEGVYESSPAWSHDSTRLAYFVHGATTDLPHELRVMEVASRKTTVLGLMPGKLGQRRQSVAWLPGQDALVVTDVRGGDSHRRLFRVSLATGEMTRISSGYADARFPSAGPLVNEAPARDTRLASSAVVGPVRHPKTGHMYYAIMTAQGITGAGATAAAESMTVGGAPGHLAAVTSDEEGEFLLSELPFTHDGFWIGGRAARIQPDAALTLRRWTLGTGEEWDYTSWLNEEPNRRTSVAVWRIATTSYAPPTPERGPSLTRLMWAGKSAGIHQRGFIVEFDAPQADAAGG